jgi:hypothetical protein
MSDSTKGIRRWEENIRGPSHAKWLTHAGHTFKEGHAYLRTDRHTTADLISLSNWRSVRLE